VNWAQGAGLLGADVVGVARTPLAEREAVLSMTQAAATPGARASASSRARRILVAIIKPLGRFIIPTVDYCVIVMRTVSKEKYW
jgi:hypothetical protein